MIDVVAAIIPCNNTILLCQRSEKAVHPLEWEFPGGKIHDGESPEETLARELNEELSLSVEECQFIYSNTYRYEIEKIIVNLIFYMVRVKDIAYTNHIFNQVEFVKLEEINKKNLLHADREFWPYILEAINSGNLLNRFNNGG